MKSTIFYRHKLKIVGGLLLLLYVVVCPCCMTMRTNPTDTKTYFNTAKTNYKDTVVVVDEIPIHYIETGNRNLPTLFFVHGSPGSWDAYKQYLTDSLLLRKFRMIAIDRPGFGYSNFREAENLSTQSRVLEKLIRKIKNNQPVFLIGHSMGGPVIAKMATERPKEYKALVILAGAVDPKAEKPEKWRYFIKSKPLRYLVPGALQPSNDELYWLKDDLKTMEPNLYKIVCEVVIIHGTLDDLVPYSNVAFLKQTLVNAKSVEVISIKGANHFIPWTHYDTIRNRLLELK